MLYTLQTFKDFNSLSSDTSLDTLYTMYLNEASEMVIDYLGYNPEKADYKLSVKGLNCNLLKLGVMPINIVTKVTVGGLDYDPSLFTIDGEYLVSDSLTFEGNCYVEFNAGYTNVPSSILMAVIRIASIRKTEEGGKIGITSISDSLTGNKSFIRPKLAECLQAISQYQVLKL